MKEILQQKDKILHRTTSEVPVRDIATPKVKKILREMSSALKSQGDGVAIAAPQIGYSIRIFVVSGKIFEKSFIENKIKKIENNIEKKLLNKNSTQEENPKNKKVKDLVFINPKISKLSKEKEWMPEGCLSVRWLYGKTFRSKKVMLSAYDENGKKFIRGASGLLAQIFQHETDHLNGILFTDHAKDVKEELPK